MGSCPTYIAEDIVMLRSAQVFLISVALLLGLIFSAGARAYAPFAGFSQAELDQMLAPVALYPDTVLSHVLIAATYPIEVVQAARWTRQNQGLRGEVAVNAVIGQDWDPSVMALAAFPELLARMDADLDWTQRLGDAFLIQEEEVLDSIQRLRAQAFHAGHLRSSEQVRVIREREVIYIEPPRRQVVFVPVYDTRVVFGSWAWAHHPPVFWHPPRHRHSALVFWGPAFHVPPAFFFSSFHWTRREVVVVHHHHHYFRPHQPRSRSVVHHHHYRGHDLARHDAAQRWQHDPGHRRGVAYHPAVDDRHRQIERRAGSSPAGQPAPPVRVADSLNSQREWAATRRAQPILSQSQSQSRNDTARSSRTLGEHSRSAAGASAQRAPAPAGQRPATAAAQRSDGAANRVGSLAGARSDQRSSPAAARSVERQIRDRATSQSDARAGLRHAPAASAPAAPSRAAAPAARPQANVRRAPRPDQEAQRAPRPMSPSATPAAPAAPIAGRPAPARSTEFRAGSGSGSTAIPARPGGTAANAGAHRPASPAARSAPSRPVSAVPPGRVPDSRAASAPRSEMQRQSPPAAPARSQSRSQPERRPARRVD